MTDQTLAKHAASLKRDIDELKSLQKFVERQGFMLNITFKLEADTSNGYGGHGHTGTSFRIRTTWGPFLSVLEPLLKRKETEIAGMARHIAGMKERMSEEEIKAQAKELKENEDILTAVMKAAKS